MVPVHRQREKYAGDVDNLGIGLREDTRPRNQTVFYCPTAEPTSGAP